MMIGILAGLYVSLSIVLASAAAELMPARRLPSLHVAHSIRLAAVSGILVFAIGALWMTSANIAKTFQLPLLQTFLQLLYDSLQGTGVLALLVCGVVWFGADAFARGKARSLLLLAASIGFVLAAAVTMHAATLSLKTYLAQAIHLLAVSFWLGWLLLMGWFAKARSPWLAFLTWYSPAAVLCVIAVTISGLQLMADFSTEYVNAWVLDYGQVLLMKHLLILPLLAFAVINGIWTRRRLRQSDSYDPRSWFRAEGVLALVIFAVTAALSRTAPPHDLRQTLLDTPPSALFTRIYPGTVTADIQLSFVFQPLTLIFAVASFLFMGMMFLVYYKRMQASIGFAAAFLFAISGYFAVMTAVQ